MDEIMNYGQKRTCNGCKALTQAIGLKRMYCRLGATIDLGQLKPLEKCHKPRTYEELSILYDELMVSLRQAYARKTDLHIPTSL